MVIALPKLSLISRKTLIYLLAAVILAFLFPIFLFYIESFAESDFYTFLLYGFDRAYFPAFLLLTILGIFCSKFVISQDR